MIRYFLLFSFLFPVLLLAQDEKLDTANSVSRFFLDKKIHIDSLSNQYLYYKVYDWIGTCYKYAGNTKEGIDCSGFVNEIYSSVFCIGLAGGSADIYKLVVPIEKENLKEGDLVFFKIKKGRVSHVGIYLQNNKFAHATVHNGVIISDLDEAYYKKYYYKGGKLIVD